MILAHAHGVERPWHRAVVARLRSRSGWIVVFAFLALFALYSTLIRDVVQNGDAAVYNEQIADHVLVGHLIHVGYIALGNLFHALLPFFRLDCALNLMALTCGIGGGAALYAIATHWGSRLAGVASVLFLLCSASYVRGMVLAEVDILSAAFVTISYAFYARRRPVIAGLFFGVAMLSTPVTLSMIPLFVFTFSLHERGIRATVTAQSWRVLCFGLAGLALYAPWVLWHFHDYFYGNRGVFSSPYARFNLGEQITRGASFFQTDVWGLVPLYCAGLFSALVDRSCWRRDQPAIGVALSVITTALFVDRAGDVPVHLASVPLLGLCAALLLDRAATALKAVWSVPCFAFALMGIPAYLAARAEIEEGVRLRDTYRAMRAESQPLSAMLVDLPHGFSDHRFFEHYAYGHSYTNLVPSLAEFRHRLHSLQTGPDEYAIYFVHQIPRDLERALRERYQASVWSSNGAKYARLMPNSRAQ